MFTLFLHCCRSGVVTTVAGRTPTPSADGSGFADGPALTAAQFHSIQGIAVDPTTGAVVVADTGNQRIRVIGADGTCPAPLPSAYLLI